MKRLFTNFVPLFLGGGFYTPGDNGPPGPGSPGGTYGGPSGSDGSAGGYTGFVIGDGGTGNQYDVDALNQITQEMDAAFGVGNWDTDMIGLIMETINNNAEVDTAVEAVDKIITEGIESEPRLINIYNNLGGSVTFNAMLNEFDGENSITDLRFRASDFIDEFPDIEDEEYWDATAITRKLNNSNLIEIVFNTSDLLDSSIHNFPNIVLAMTFVHELIHAEMYRQLMETLGQGSTDFTQAQLDQYLMFDNALLFNLYVNNFTNQTDPQHELMAFRYRQKIKQVLGEYNTGLTENQKDALSWLGLEGTFAHTLAMAANPHLQNLTQSALQLVMQNGNYGSNE